MGVKSGCKQGVAKSEPVPCGLVTDWEQMCPAEHLQIRSSQSEQNVAGC